MLKVSGKKIEPDYLDDYTVIPVKIFIEKLHSHDIEEGIFTNCQHVNQVNQYCQNENCLEFVD